MRPTYRYEIYIRALADARVRGYVYFLFLYYIILWYVNYCHAYNTYLYLLTAAVAFVCRLSGWMADVYIHDFETQTRIPVGDKMPAVTLPGLRVGEEVWVGGGEGERERERKWNGEKVGDVSRTDRHVSGCVRVCVLMCARVCVPECVFVRMCACLCVCSSVMRALSGRLGRVYNPLPRITDKTWQRAAAGDKLLRDGWRRRRPRRTSLFSVREVDGGWEGQRKIVRILIPPGTGWFGP